MGGSRALAGACGLAVVLGLVLAVPAAAVAQTEYQREPRSDFGGLYILGFNRQGQLTNPLDLELAIRDLGSNSELERIVIFSYGWGSDGESSFATYVEMLTEMLSHQPARGGRRTAIIGVGWDSSTSGFRKLFNDMIPLPVIADTLAFIPDTLLFPISFWSKAGQADRIGFGGLRTALNELFSVAFPDPEKRPEIFLVGHSFGTRILSGLMQNRLAGMRVRADPFVARDRVKGAVLLQPALVPANLHRDAEYPVMVTQSRHDHANGFLYPLANALVNAYSFTTLEAIIDQGLLSPIQTGIETTVDRVSDLVTAPLPGREQQEKTEPREPGLPRRAVSRVRRGVAELVAIPASIVFSLVTLPVNYVYVQVRGLVTHPVDHVMDTFAQLPLLEVPVWALDRVLGREIHWGTLSKGFFSLGSLNESSGHAAAPGPLLGRLYPVYLPDQLLDAASARALRCGLPVCEGVLGVEASSIVRTGSFGENLQNPWVDFTIGWLDLVGAHGDYRGAEVMRLLRLVARDPDEPEASGN